MPRSTFSNRSTYQDATLDVMLETDLVDNFVLLQTAVSELRKHAAGRAIFISSTTAEGGSTMASPPTRCG